MENLYETLHVKHTFDDKELAELARKMAGAESRMREKQDTLKQVSTEIKAQIAEQEAILHSAAERLRSGYEMRPKQCLVTYTPEGIIKYADKETGEILEERPMTQEEQLRLTERRTDAETIIRAESEAEDE